MKEILTIVKDFLTYDITIPMWVYLLTCVLCSFVSRVLSTVIDSLPKAKKQVK